MQWHQDENGSIDIERVSIKGRLAWWVAGVVTIASACVYITILVMQFWHQAEIFRHDVIQQITEMNSNIKKLAEDKTIVRLPDLGAYCIMQQRVNKDFNCPSAFTELELQNRFTYSQPTQDNWRAQTQK